MTDFNILAWITGAPVAFGIIVAAVIFATIWGIRIHSYHRQPTPYRVADYLMSMPHIHERFKATLFTLPVQYHTELLDTFKKVAGDGLADTFEKNRGKWHFYVANHLSTEAGTIESGLSILMSEASLDHGEYYVELEESMNVVMGRETRLREVSQSGPEGMIWKKARKWKGDAVNLVYYPAKPIVKNPTVDTPKLEMVKVALSVVPMMDVWYDDLQKSNYNDLKAKSADRAKDRALTSTKQKTEENNLIKHTLSIQEYFAQSILGSGGPLPLAIALLIVGGCAVLLPDVLAKQMPGYTQQQYIGFSVAIGAGIVALISMFRKSP